MLKLYLYVTQSAAENAEVGGFLLINIWNVLLQRLKTLFEVRSPEGPRVRNEKESHFDKVVISLLSWRIFTIY